MLLCKQHQHRERKCCGGGWSECVWALVGQLLLCWGLLMEVNIQVCFDFLLRWEGGMAHIPVAWYHV